MVIYWDGPKNLIKSHRRQILKLTPELFLDLFRGEHRYKITDQGIPEDAEVLTVRFDLFDGIIELLIESEQFSEVSPGGMYPEICPFAERIIEDGKVKQTDDTH